MFMIQRSEFEFNEAPTRTILCLKRVPNNGFAPATLAIAALLGATFLTPAKSADFEPIRCAPFRKLKRSKRPSSRPHSN
jgi:hypothetical protein